MTIKRHRATFAAALVGLALSPSAAEASSCLVAADPAGDHALLLEPSPLPVDLRSNLDLTGLSFDGSSAFVRVQDLSEAVPAGSTSASWVAAWADAAGTHRFVAANVSLAGGTTYTHGTLDPDGWGLTTKGSTTGAFLPGSNGVIRIDLPQPAGVLASPYASTREVRASAGNYGAVNQADRAPDAGGGTAYTGDSCRR